MQAFSPRHTQSPLCGLSLLLLIAHFVLVEPIEGVYCSTASAPYVSALRLRRSNPVPSANSTTTKTELTLGLFLAHCKFPVGIQNNYAKIVLSLYTKNGISLTPRN